MSIAKLFLKKKKKSPPSYTMHCTELRAISQDLSPFPSLLLHFLSLWSSNSSFRAFYTQAPTNIRQHSGSPPPTHTHPHKPTHTLTPQLTSGSDHFKNLLAHLHSYDAGTCSELDLSALFPSNRILFELAAVFLSCVFATEEPVPSVLRGSDHNLRNLPWCELVRNYKNINS